MALVNFFGAASGLDTGTLINSLLEQQRKSRIAPIQKKIDSLQETRSAFSDLSSKLNKLRDLTAQFRDINGGAISKTSNVSDESVLAATPGKGAFNTSVAINVTQLASNASISFNNTFTQLESAVKPSGSNASLSITIGSGNSAETINLAVGNTTTVSDLVASFNQSTDKAVASTVNVGTAGNPQYKIVFNTLNEGTTAGSLIIEDPANVFSGQTVSQATDATLSISGISGSITRDSNSIADLIPGVKLDLKRTGTTTLSILSDSDTTSSDVKNMVDALNDIISYANQNDLITSENVAGNTRAIFGSLALTSLDESLISSLKSGLSSSSILGGAVNSLADLGITTNRDGSLGFDEKIFNQSLGKESSSVSKILSNLGESLAKTGGIIDQFSRFGGLLDTARTNTDQEISRMNQKITDLEKILTRQEETLIAQFSRLEGQISKMQSQGAYLQNILTGLK
jgi:flagellar hook-associated protein 2